MQDLDQERRQMLAVSGITRYVSEGSRQLPGLLHIPAVAHLASAGDLMNGPCRMKRGIATLLKEKPISNRYVLDLSN